MKINAFLKNVLPFLVVLSLLASCKSKAPAKEDVPEMITKVTLTFTPTGGGTPVVGTATDPDGQGVKPLTTDGPITLAATTQYTMEIQMINGLAQQGASDYDVTKLVEQKSTEHQFFFSWTNNMFSDPAGDGNIDHFDDPLNYTGGTFSKDANGLPLGITTTWTTVLPKKGNDSGQFRVMLKHQPGLKTNTSGSDVGATDMDITFDMAIQ